ncbi:hypothetical protein N8I77_002430 [Diaporthe amygdali]|uniref:Uncharacterized protein n=1 Tax=Phomopsis amygdali TaxID=1214568 RepID=A0AAD9WAD5_PHOAM|nr:hypothetical protein N8I77_002430 [Diaporthe amygdali]
MTPQTAQKRQYSAAELAMLDDIGAGRVDELPLQDSGALPRTDAAMSSIESGRTGTKNRWNQAIAGGAFDDDDAAVVAGQDDLASGQLARMRRAANLSYMAINSGFDFNDRRLRQERNGQVAPRARFSHPGRASRAGRFHSGDEPVELRGSLPSSRHAPVSATVTTPSPGSNTQRPERFSMNGMPTSILPQAQGSGRSPSSQAQRLASSKPPAEPTAVPIPSITPQEEVQQPSLAVKFELPDNCSIFFEAPATFASPTFVNRTAEYPGTIYLVAGPVTTSDQIILHIDEDRVEDVKRQTKEYVDYLSDTDRLILQFKDDSGRITWFVVVFRQRDSMVSFVDALRKFVNRPKETSPNPATTNTGQVTVGISDELIEPAHSTASVVAIPQQQDPTRTISVAILEDIVSWTMHIVAFVRDSGPAELANADALPGIIRGASAAVLFDKQAGFSELDSKQRVAFIDEVCAPQVFERFKRRMLEDAAKRPPTEAETEIAPGTQKSPEMQETTPTEQPPPTYTIQELFQLESAAESPPDYLTEMRYLPEMTSATRNLIQQVIRRARRMDEPSLPVQTSRTSGRAPPEALRTSPANAGYGFDGNVSPSRRRIVNSRDVDAPAITITAPIETPNPEEPLICLSGKMTGLNSSRHNKNGVDRLGQSAGQFTGALSRDKSYLEDLMLIDRVEDFDVIRANDPEIAEIADRFARVHFGEGPA